jgi:HTH-type transcriptional regulator / antitoxin HigA
MRPKPIVTEADHDLAVARITELMGAASGTPESEELDALASAVDAWESEHHPMDPPTDKYRRRARKDANG